MKINESTFEAEPDFVIIDDDVKEEIISYCPKSFSGVALDFCLSIKFLQTKVFKKFKSYLIN